MATLEFLGAAGTVTGSKYLLRACGKTILFDAGLYQGLKEHRLRNWDPLPVPPSEIDLVVLTHAHIDHSGYLPVLVRDGYARDVLATSATCDLLHLLLPDSGRLQEEEAETANTLGYSKHSPAKPLYTESDAKAALPRLKGVAYHQKLEPFPGISLTFRPAGHILGSATIEVNLDDPESGRKRILFSGDLGRFDAPIIPDPEPVTEADVLLVECTYGNKHHAEGSPREELAQAIIEAHRNGGSIVIPSFAIGRAQEILYHLRALESEGKIPILDVFVDSPMAIDATPMFQRHVEEHDDEMRSLLARGIQPIRTHRLQFTRSQKESQAINHVGRCIIISASGMATGGRILHHLKLRLPNPKTTVLLVGYQAEGTRGRALQEGAPTVKIHGENIPVRAKILTLGAFSAHGDAGEIDRWLSGFTKAPARTWCVHGEPEGLEATQQRLTQRGWNASVAAYRQVVTI